MDSGAGSEATARTNEATGTSAGSTATGMAATRPLISPEPFSGSVATPDYFSGECSWTD